MTTQYVQTDPNIITAYHDDGTEVTIEKGELRITFVDDIEKIETGKDENGEPIYKERPWQRPVSYELWQELLDKELAGEITIEWKPDNYFLEQYKQQKTQWLNRMRDLKIAENIEYQGKIYQARKEDLDNISGALQLAQIAERNGQTFQTEWIAEDNTTVVAGISFIAGLAEKIGQRKEILIHKARTYKNHLLSLQNKTEIDNYIKSISWE